MQFLLSLLTTGSLPLSPVPLPSPSVSARACVDGVRPDESTWTMGGGAGTIIFSMEKAEEGQWPFLLHEEPGGGLSL